MKNSKILIVEDEQIIAENLRYILNEYGYSYVDVAIDADEAKSLFKANTYNLVLMDINLGDNSTIDGIDLIKELKQDYNFAFMYVTANTDAKTVEKVTETNPNGFVVKPFVSAAIYANVKIALTESEPDTYYKFSHKGMQQKINISKITYIKADGAYIYFHTNTGDTHLLRKSLSELEDLYPKIFVRIHRSLLVNKNHIQSYNNQFVKISDTKLPIGRTYKQSFLEQV